MTHCETNSFDFTSPLAHCPYSSLKRLGIGYLKSHHSIFTEQTWGQGEDQDDNGSTMSHPSEQTGIESQRETDSGSTAFASGDPELPEKRCQVQGDNPGGSAARVQNQDIIL